MTFVWLIWLIWFSAWPQPPLVAFFYLERPRTESRRNDHQIRLEEWQKIEKRGSQKDQEAGKHTSPGFARPGSFSTRHTQSCWTTGGILGEQKPDLLELLLHEPVFDCNARNRNRKNYPYSNVSRYPDAGDTRYQGYHVCIRLSLSLSIPFSLSLGEE